MLDRMTIRARLLLAGAVSAACLILMAGVAFYGNQQSARAMAVVHEDNVKPLMAIQEMDASLQQLRFHLASVLLDAMSLQGARNYVGEVRGRLPETWGRFKQRIDLDRAPAEERELIGKIDKQMAALPELLGKLERAYEVNDRNALARILSDDWPVYHKNLVKPLSQLIPAKVSAVGAAYDASLALTRRLDAVALAVFAASALFLAWIGWRITGSIHAGIKRLDTVLGRMAQGDLSVSADTGARDELGEMARALNATIERLRGMLDGMKRAADTLATSSARLSAESHRVMDRAKAESDNVAQVGAAVEQMSVASREIAASTDEAAKASDESRRVAEQGNEHMSKGVEASGRIVAAVGDSGAIMAELSESIGRINEVTRVIRDIADQTNLLALNAAIEAARAGEQGRGFAVVADEVRKLAERTAVSTADIEGMVQGVLGRAAAAMQAMQRVTQEVESGATCSRAAKEMLDRIVAESMEMKHRITEIAAAAQEQMTASESTARAMAEISATTENNAHSTELVEQEAGATAGTAAELQRMAGQFRTSA